MGSEFHTSGGAKPARPRSTASDTYVSQPLRTNILSQPSRPSGVDSYVTPVSPPPCHSNSGSLPLRSFGRKYCTYICSTMYWPFGSSLVSGPPGCRTISRTGLPLISTTRPPTWNEPMPRSTMSCSAATAAVRPAARAAIAIMTRCILRPPLDLPFVPEKAGTQFFITLDNISPLGSRLRGNERSMLRAIVTNPRCRWKRTRARTASFLTRFLRGQPPAPTAHACGTSQPR